MSRVRRLAPFQATCIRTKWQHACRSFVAITVTPLLFLADLSAQTAARNNFGPIPGQATRPKGQALDVRVSGTGPRHVVVLTGHMHGPEYVEAMTQRLGGPAITFHVITPPGMGGTLPYSIPEEAEKFSARSWSEQFESDLSEYLRRHVPTPPVLLAGWDVGLGLALHMAARFPTLLAGLVLVGDAPYHHSRRQVIADTSGTFNFPAKQAQVASFLPFWKTVGDSVWHANTYPWTWYTRDAALGQALKDAERRRPMQVALRWFLEYVSHDPTVLLAECRLPTLIIAPLAVRAGADSAGVAMTRALARNSWQIRPGGCREIAFLDEARLMAWVDAPAAFDTALVSFLERTARKATGANRRPR
jgi:pimeloyl-ACP methyl ester carboxylesterase